MSPDVIKSKMQIAEEIIHKLEEFIRSEQAFSQDYYISATEPLLQLEDLLDYCRLHLPHRLDLIERTEQERNRLFEWARIANKTNDAEAKVKTKGFAIRLVKKLQQILELLRDELAAEKPAKAKPNATPAKDGKEKTTIINIKQNSKSIFGGVQQVENVQTGDQASIHKQPAKGGLLKNAKRFLDWVLKLWLE